MSQSRKIRLGVILGAHGVRGQVRVRSFTEEPAALFSYGPLTDEKGGRTLELVRCGEGKDCFIASIEGVSSRTQAEKLKGAELFVNRDTFPSVKEGEYYLADLIGLEARDEKGDSFGVVEAAHDYGAGVFLQIKPTKGKSFMLPFKDAFVPKVDLERAFLVAVVPEGWLKEEKPPKKGAPNVEN